MFTFKDKLDPSMMPLLEPACWNVIVAFPVLLRVTVTVTNGPPDTPELLSVKLQLEAEPTQSLSAMAAVAAKSANVKPRIRNLQWRIVLSFFLGGKANCEFFDTPNSVTVADTRILSSLIISARVATICNFSDNLTTLFSV